MAADNTIIGGVIAGLTTAVGWLAKRLYDAPRPQDVDALRKDRDDLRAVVLEATHEATRLARERELENRKLRDEISELRITVERRVGAPGVVHGRKRATTRRPGHDRRDQTET